MIVARIDRYRPGTGGQPDDLARNLGVVARGGPPELALVVQAPADDLVAGRDRAAERVPMARMEDSPTAGRSTESSI